MKIKKNNDSELATLRVLPDTGASIDCVKDKFVKNATMICARKKDMHSFNTSHLNKLQTPIAKMKANNSKGSRQTFLFALWIYLLPEVHI